MQKRYEIFLNPIAGKGYASKHIPLINEYLQNYKMDYEIHLTKYVGHAIKLAEEFSQQPNTAVIAAGGDGTCNEVVNGLMQAKKINPELNPIFGVIPIGRGNDFSFGADIPNDLKESLNAIVHGEPVPMDVGLVKGGNYPEGRYFGNGIGVGFDTKVGLEAAKLKHIHGAFAYLIGALKTLILYPPAPNIELTYNDITTNISPALVSIMNGKRMGGTFFMAPNANNSDGVLNLCFTKQGSRRELLKTMMYYIKGTQHTLENTTVAQSAAFSMKALNGSLAVHADGETICESGKYLDISCLPHALNIIKKSANK
jgi:diacylglycerol kinase (ATP)